MRYIIVAVYLGPLENGAGNHSGVYIAWGQGSNVRGCDLSVQSSRADVQGSDRFRDLWSGLSQTINSEHKGLRLQLLPSRFAIKAAVSKEFKV